MNEKIYLGKVSLGIKMKRALWNVARCILFRPFGTKLFRLWRLSVLKAFGADVDWGCDVYASSKVWAPWNLTMEQGSCLGPETVCYNQAMVTLRKNACLSQYAMICTAGHELDAEGQQPMNNAETGLVVAPVTLHEDAWVGMRAFVGMGVEVGRKAVVGACACVFKDVESKTVVGGNPAKVLRTLD